MAHAPEIGPGRNPLESIVHAEWDTLRDVVIHRPGIEMFFGLIEPFAFLYERSFNMDLAIHEHDELRHALDTTGTRVHRLRSLAIRLARDDPEIVRRLRTYAKKIVKFEGASGEARERAESSRPTLPTLAYRRPS